MRPRLVVQIASIIVALVALEAPAASQGLFGWFGQRDDRYPRQDSWFGEQRQHSVPQANAYADPRATMQEPRYGAPTTPSIGGGGRYVAYCVRLCDGRFFPMQRHSNATSIQLCNAFCPSAKTQVFNGSQIDHAVASNGARYANLENAFVYREKIVAGCTCNGKDTFGLAKVDIKSDPTLKPGDIVATEDSQKAAFAAAANRHVRNVISEKAALRGSKTAKASNPDDEERPED